jgi:hypothetical protein
MAKRFTDTDKWKKPFIRGLQGAYKLLWMYILDDCDHAGIWQVDMDVAQVRIGEKLDYNLAITQFSGKIISFSNGEKWFIPAFIDFQYGTLNPENRAHGSVLNLLKKYNLIDIENKPLTSPLQGGKDMDMDKELVKEEDKVILAKKIIFDFGFNEISNFDKLKSALQFLTFIQHQNRFDYFVNQYKSYWEFKNKSGEQKHNFTSFLGTPAKQYENAGWDTANWTEKLKELNSTKKPDKMTETVKAFAQVENPFRK